MTPKHVRQTLTLIVFTLAVASCNSTEIDNRPVVEIDNFDGGILGCAQPSFPSDQPDISPLTPPEFVTETGEQEELIRPGQELLGQITVNGATRRVFVEFSNAWAPEQVIYTEDLETPGNQTISVFFFPGENVRGRFYMRLTLCGFDCDEREVMFDITDLDPDTSMTTGINGDYERTLIEKGDVVQVDQTCVRPNSVLIQ